MEVGPLQRCMYCKNRDEMFDILGYAAVTTKCQLSELVFTKQSDIHTDRSTI